MLRELCAPVRQQKYGEEEIVGSSKRWPRCQKAARAWMRWPKYADVGSCFGQSIMLWRAKLSDLVSSGEKTSYQFGDSRRVMEGRM